MDEKQFREGFRLIYANRFNEAIALFEAGLALTSEPERVVAERQTAESISRENFGGGSQRRPSPAEILFGICCCYRAMLDIRGTSLYLRQVIERSAEDEGFRFSAIVTFMKDHSQDRMANLSHLLPSLNKFISDMRAAEEDSTQDSPFVPIGLAARTMIRLNEWRRDPTTETFHVTTLDYLTYEIEKLVSCCPGFSLTIELEMAMLSYLCNEKWLERCSRILKLIRPTWRILRHKALIFYRKGCFVEMFKTFQERFETKVPRNVKDYKILFSFWTPKYIYAINSIFLACIDKSPNRVLEAMIKVSISPRIDLIAAGYAALCLVKLERFDEAIDAYSSLNEEVQRLSMEGVAETDCQIICEKIADFNIEIARRRHASFVIYRALLDAYHRPGGPGYFNAFNHFNSLAGAR